MSGSGLNHVIVPAHDALLWDQRFEHPEPAYGMDPSLFLVEQADLFRPGQSVLLPADGEGRNGLWLARRGLRVTCVDFSAVALAKVRAAAGREGLSVATKQHDLLTWVWPCQCYDHVVSVYFHAEVIHRHRLHRAMADALVPGGHFLLEGFHRDQMGMISGGPRDPAMLFDDSTLRSDCADLHVKILRRDEVDLAEGRLHRGAAVLMRMLAQAPLE